jgi:hypothetical protein
MASTPRTPLQFAVSAITVALVIYSQLELVVPFLLAWAIWGLMQRSKRPDRRWIAWAFAIPAAFLLWKIVGLIWKLKSLGLPEIVLLGGLLLWLFLRPGKVPLLFQIALHATVVCLFLVRVLPYANLGLEGLPGKVADLYFFVGSIGASVLALRRGPKAVPAELAAE